MVLGRGGVGVVLVLSVLLDSSLRYLHTRLFITSPLPIRHLKELCLSNEESIFCPLTKDVTSRIKAVCPASDYLAQESIALGSQFPTYKSYDLHLIPSNGRDFYISEVK